MFCPANKMPAQRFVVMLFVLMSVLYGVCRSLSPQCITNCSTLSTSTSLSSKHLVLCNIRESSCVEYQANATPPGKPKSTTGDDDDKAITTGWYLYKRPGDNFDSIALNFSWAPVQDGSVEYLHGYEITLYHRETYRGKTFYYCLNTSMKFNQHVFSNFYHDCYGIDDGEIINPGDIFDIFVSSLPSPSPVVLSESLQIKVEIPYCDQDPRLHNVETCVCENAFNVSIEKYICDSRTFQISYFVPNCYGSSASLYLCYIEDASDGHPSCKEMLNQRDSLPLFSKQLNVTIPKTHSLFKNYSVTVYGNVKNQATRRAYAIFPSSCKKTVDEKTVDKGINLLPIVLPICFVLIVIIGFVIYVKRSKFVHLAKSCPNPNACDSDTKETAAERNTLFLPGNMSERNNKEHETVLPTQTIYLTYVDDHPKHREVVLRFASYLHSDLGFNVIFELWQQDEIYKGCHQWMENAMKKSNKIIVIWSPKAKLRWEKSDPTLTSQQDLFSPVLVNIKRDLFCDKNVGKYFFAYFDYCSESDIPDEFRELSFSQFKLMKQFEELYFRLKSLEMFHPSGIRREEKVAYDRYFEETKYGPDLERAINEMHGICQQNPCWFKPGQAVVNSAPQSMVYDNSSQDQDSHVPQVNQLDIAPPPPLFGSGPLCSQPADIVCHVVDAAQAPVQNEISSRQSSAQPAELGDSFVIDTDSGLLSEQSNNSDALLDSQSSRQWESVNINENNLGKRVPCENEDLREADQSCSILTPLQEQNCFEDTKSSSAIVGDSGFSASPPNSPRSEHYGSIQPLSFHFEDDEEHVDNEVVDDVTPLPKPKQILVPLDMTGDPWKSLASMNEKI